MGNEMAGKQGFKLYRKAKKRHQLDWSSLKSLIFPFVPLADKAQPN
jgi:hypothetical protein